MQDIICFYFYCNGQVDVGLFFFFVSEPTLLSLKGFRDCS